MSVQTGARSPMDAPQDAVEIVIESPRFSYIKRTASGGIDFVSPLPCPFNYGCVPSLISGDGDPMDAVVLGPRLARHAHVRLPVRAVVDFVDAGDPDPKWICKARPLNAIDRASVHLFFVVYARAKHALNALRGRTGVTAYRGLRVVA